MYQRILVPVDSSPSSNRGLEEAIRVAELTDGRLRLIHVVDELSMELYTSARAGGWLDALRASGERILERAKPMHWETASRSTPCCTATPPARSTKRWRPKQGDGPQT